MAPALPGQLGPVRLLGWQRFLSVRVQCSRGRRFCSLGSAWGSLSPACFVLTSCEGRSVNGSAILLECLSLCPFPIPPLCILPIGTHRHRVTHPKLMPTFIETHIHTQRHMHTHTHILAAMCLYALKHTPTHTVLNTHSHMLTVSVCLTHTPCLSTWCQAICCLYSFPVFVSSSCSFLAVPISF